MSGSKLRTIEKAIRFKLQGSVANPKLFIPDPYPPTPFIKDIPVLENCKKNAL